MYSSVGFRITRHEALTPPDGAMSLLCERLPNRSEDVCFSTVGAVLGALEEICDHAPELELDWYAVSAAG
jgi:hypothetical protein